MRSRQKLRPPTSSEPTVNPAFVRDELEQANAFHRRHQTDECQLVAGYRGAGLLIPVRASIRPRVMDEEVLAHMRARVQQLRKVKSLAHDPRMIELIQKIIDSGEADIAKLEAERNVGQD